jgi:hypothetical protein
VAQASRIAGTFALEAPAQEAERYVKRNGIDEPQAARRRSPLHQRVTNEVRQLERDEQPDAPGLAHPSA